ncbi:unnamed protein product, partial [Citrullus colocynthis]
SPRQPSTLTNRSPTSSSSTSIFASSIVCKFPLIKLRVCCALPLSIGLFRVIHIIREKRQLDIVSKSH